MSSFNAKSKEMKNTTSLFSSLLHSNQPITATMCHLSMQKLKEMKNTTSLFLLYYTVINRPITANHYFGETHESKTWQSFLHPFKLNTGCSEFVLKKTKRHEGGRSLPETTVSTVKSGDMSYIAHCSLLQGAPRRKTRLWSFQKAVPYKDQSKRQLVHAGINRQSWR